MHQLLAMTLRLAFAWLWIEDSQRRCRPFVDRFSASTKRRFTLIG